MSNSLAKLAVYACARLGGYITGDELHSTPDNPGVKKSLIAMLTPYLAKKLSENNPTEVCPYICRQLDLDYEDGVVLTIALMMQYR